MLILESVCLIFTCKRTLAVSRGNVKRSATQAADPAVRSLTGSDGSRNSIDPPVILGAEAVMGAI
jgi:hypothetical protein